MIIELALEEEAHRAAYVALLRSALRAPGSKERLAHAAGISRVYLSYLLNPAGDDEGTFRVPSARVAERIAEVLPAERAVREQVREHMLLASQRRLRRERVVAGRMGGEAIRVAVAEVGAAHHRATHLARAAEAGAEYRAVRDVTRQLLGAIRPEQDTQAFLECCFLLHDTQCLLNRPGEAVYAARRARLVVEDRLAREGRRIHLLRREVQAIRAEAVAYHDLGLDRLAYARCVEAEETDAAKREPAEHLIHVYRDKVNALSGIPRFAVSEVTGLADQAERLAERSENALHPLWNLLGRRSEARAYLRHGNVRRASAILEAQLERASRIPMMGPLHWVLVRRTAAEIAWARGDEAGWREAMREVVRQAVGAGLNHQLMELWREYGEALRPLLAEAGGELEDIRAGV